jgi:hypothetical protein
VLAHRRAHGLTSDQVERIEVSTFHESIRRATNAPQATGEAQYSTSFSCVVALVRSDLTPAELGEKFHEYAVPVAGAERSAALAAAVGRLELGGLGAFLDPITAQLTNRQLRPIRRSTTAGKSE